MREIACEDCGAPRKTRMKNTKYCHACRLLKDLSFLRDRTGECVACGRKHSLTQRKAWLCQRCTADSGNYREGHCGVCGKENARLVWQEVAVCVDCMDNPEQRGPIIKGLIQKIARNREEYGTVAE